jgi:hypothetical protein
METNTTRRSDRVSLELPLQLSGTDSTGQGYIAEGRTLLLSRHGAKIVLNRKLSPHQELTVRCLSTNSTADARVVGLIGRGPHGYFYGIEFLDEGANPWKIEFPPMADAHKAVARTLLECSACKTRAIAYMSDIEAEIFEANRCLPRTCQKCGGKALWTEPVLVIIEGPDSTPSAKGFDVQAAMLKLLRSQNERQDTRAHLRMTACVRSPEFGEEVVFTEDVSNGGLRFKSPKRYSLGSVIEVAVPYTRKVGNIFVLAQIEWEYPLPNEGVTLFGAWYVQMQGSKIERVEEATR